ncbi:MAG: hypothetical protein R3220_00420 [Balneolaceae bacterium]|nr:hypothetical protein [Balneolaceae bacterium]
METLVIKVKNSADSRKIREFAEKMGAEQKSYTQEEMEDIGLLFLMQEADRSEHVPEEEIMRILDAE